MHPDSFDGLTLSITEPRASGSGDPVKPTTKPNPNPGIILDGFRPRLRPVMSGSKVLVPVKGYTHRNPLPSSLSGWQPRPLRRLAEGKRSFERAAWACRNFQASRRVHRIRRDHPGIASAIDHTTALL